MGLDDLLGLLFLFFFIILPALQGFLRRGQQIPPDFEPDEIPLPGENRPPPAPSRPSPSPTPQTTPPQPSAPPPAARPAPHSPPGVPKPQAPRPKPVPTRAKGEEARREPQTRRETEPQAPPPPTPKLPRWQLSTQRDAILNGVVWHQILAEPRSRYWRRVRKPRR